jgi:hypothetical protein
LPAFAASETYKSTGDAQAAKAMYDGKHFSLLFICAMLL